MAHHKVMRAHVYDVDGYIYGALTKMVMDLFSVHQHDLLWQLVS